MAPTTTTITIDDDGVFRAYKIIVGAKVARKLKGALVFPEYPENHVFEGGVTVKVKDRYKRTGAFPLEDEYDAAMRRR